MKVKMLTRNPTDYKRETKKDIHMVPRNRDPEMHPFAAEREYVRALQSAKLDRMFAKPFLGVLEGTTDTVTVMSLNPEALSLAVFGTADGKIQYWNIAKKKLVIESRAHQGQIRGLCYNNNSKLMYSCGVDGMLKQWTMVNDSEVEWQQPKSSVVLKGVPHCMDHHPNSDEFCIGGSESLALYLPSRLDDPVKEWSWGRDAITSARFNPIEPTVLAAVARDNSIRLFDIRQDNPLRKLKMTLRMNSLSWNPIESFTFTTACEDYNLYTYDVRNLSTPRRVHKGHTNAVMDVDYSPTGQEFVSASYDQCIRIWPSDKAQSRDVYHTKRMKKVFSVKFTRDAKYLLSSSSDQNVRLWKARASEKLQPMQHREKTAIAQSEALRSKFSNHPEIKRVLNNRHLPRSVFAATKEHRIIRAKQRRKEHNVQMHSKPGTVPFVKEREKHVVAEIE